MGGDAAHPPDANHPAAVGRDAIASGLFGMAVGDALGVPAEFCTRDELRATRRPCVQAGRTSRPSA